MFRLFNKKKQKVIDEKVEKMNKAHDALVLECSLEKNVAIVNNLFQDVELFRTRYIDNNHDKNLKYCLVYCDGVVNASTINENLIKPLMLSEIRVSGEGAIDTVIHQIVQIGGAEKTDSLKDIAEAVTRGDTVLFINGTAQAGVFNTRGYQTRAITEPENEKSLSGPREGFTESLIVNLSMIRRKVLSPDLKMKFYSFGRRTNSKACICYMDGLVNKQILAELYRRLDEIDIDAVLDTNYITELIKDTRLSPLRTMGYTERPDVVIGKILEGRIAFFLDGTPTVLTIPYLFIENFQSSEDYYLSFFYSSFSRLTRIIGFLLTVAVPGLYISIVAYQHEMLPFQLFISIAVERKSVPFPAAVEAFVMLLAFDILRETGIRMPSNIGQALSIVGALVIGQAAVEAKLIAAPMIIVIALTGITNLLVPKLNASVIYIRLFLLILSASFGFFGFIIGASAVLIHVLNLRSFGVPQVTVSAKLQYEDIKDTFIRAPWWKMILRPRFAADRVRNGAVGNKRA